MIHLLINIAQCITSKTFLTDFYIGNLKIIINAIDLMFMNERQNYNIKLNEIKMRISLHVKKSIFRDLFTKISLFALNQMLSHYLKVINHNIKPCIKQFIITIKLLCAYVMKQRMLKATEMLRIEDIHSH